MLKLEDLTYFLEMANLIGGVNKVSSFAKEGVYTSCNDHRFNLPLFTSRA
jgi:hypothetical protein